MSARIECYLVARILKHRGAQLRNASIVFKQTYLSHSVTTFFVLLNTHFAQIVMFKYVVCQGKR